MKILINEPFSPTSILYSTKLIFTFKSYILLVRNSFPFSTFPPRKWLILKIRNFPPNAILPSRNAPLRKKYSAIIGRHYGRSKGGNVSARNLDDDISRRRSSPTLCEANIRSWIEKGRPPPVEKGGDVWREGIKGREINASISSRTRWNTLRHFGAARVPRHFLFISLEKASFRTPSPHPS